MFTSSIDTAIFPASSFSTSPTTTIALLLHCSYSILSLSYIHLPNTAPIPHSYIHLPNTATIPYSHTLTYICQTQHLFQHPSFPHPSATSIIHLSYRSLLTLLHSYTHLLHGYRVYRRLPCKSRLKPILPRTKSNCSYSEPHSDNACCCLACLGGFQTSDASRCNARGGRNPEFIPKHRYGLHPIILLLHLTASRWARSCTRQRAV